MHWLKRTIENSDTASGKVFDLLIQSLIVLSLVTFSIETIPGLSETTRKVLRIIEVATVTIFTIEYALRIVVADKKFRFVFSFFGVLDILAILPFYVASGVDLRSLRAFRLLRLVRILKLTRYSKATQRFHRALLIAKEEIILFLFIALVVLFLASAGIHYFEQEAQPEKFASIFHCMWWAVATLTTVG